MQHNSLSLNVHGLNPYFVELFSPFSSLTFYWIGNQWKFILFLYNLDKPLRIKKDNWGFFCHNRIKMRNKSGMSKKKKGKVGNGKKKKGT